MSGSHPAGPPSSSHTNSRQRLYWAFATQLLFFLVELVAGLLTNSLALLADAGHMFSDVGALGLSLLAIRFALKPPTATKTYGYHRLEILTALFNGVVLWATAAYILYEAYHRFFSPPALGGLPLMVVAALGLVVNLVGAVILFPARDESLNLRAAFLHLLADSLGSVAALVAGLAIYFKGWYWVDPVAGGLIAVMVVAGSWRLVIEAADILMEATPRHLDLDQVEAALLSHAKVQGVHDLHIWSISSGVAALSVHVRVADGHDRDCLIWELEELLDHRFGLNHVTIQTEGPGYHNPQICPLHHASLAGAPRGAAP